MDNRPRGREKNVTGQGSVNRRGSGLGTGPVGGGPRGGSGGGGNRSGGSSGGKSPLTLIIIIIVALLGGGGGLGALLGGGSSSGSSSSGYTQSAQTQTTQTSNSSSSQTTGGGYNPLSSLLGGGYGSTGSTGSSGSSYGGWTITKNTGKLDTTVANGARDKRTTIKGNGKDTVTIMVYMCGTDLESRSGMATSDVQEMVNADIAENVNIILYTGGCKSWRNSVFSSSTNQIYQVKKGGLNRLSDNVGAKAMTDPATLTEFIKWAAKNYPADRTELIMWDHGGGSLTGYGYDEKYVSNGSMNLTGLNTALKNAGVKFDFIGFDACLMATVETALMLDDYADYLIASEETEPGVGWYYTDWLTKLSANTSMSTIEIGKNIADDFVNTCAQKTSGQKTTLSVVDLAELSATVPDTLKQFSKDTSKMIQEKEYQTVSAARNGSREFAQSTRIDQIDLVHFASNLGTEAGDALVGSILGAVKYNQTSSNMTNAYGLSIYFPYSSVSKVDTAVNTYSSIGMDEEYADCIKKFASMEVSGQAASGGYSSASPLSTLLGSQTSSSSGSSMTVGNDAISQLLGAMLSGSLSSTGLTSSNGKFYTEKSLDQDVMAEYIAYNQFDPTNLVWGTNDAGQKVISLSEDQWGLVTDLALSVYYDDGEGYVDLGTDNVFDFDENGSLIGETDGTWLAINGQTVAYYYLSTVDDGENYTITGYVPAMLNGERVNLMLVFDNENPYGYVAGAEIVYDEETTEVEAKNLVEIAEGDVIDFVCDYYSYDGEYLDSYYLGDALTVVDQLEISNVILDEECFSSMYRFTDIYQQVYWTDVF